VIEDANIHPKVTRSWSPLADYEIHGFFGNVIFATGAFAEDDRLTIYYGAADKHVCGTTMSIHEILAGLD
jgi:predicted GH43/DUF377 family glycosyl hydrolase